MDISKMAFVLNPKFQNLQNFKIMNPSSYFSFAKSALFFSAMLLSLSACQKENVQPKESAATYEAPSSIKPKAIVMPGTTDRKILVEDGDEMKQESPDRNLIMDDNPIVNPKAKHNRFKQIGENEEISTQARPGRGTVDPSRFKTRGLIKKDTPL